MSFAGGFLQGLGGGMQMRQNRNLRRQELSAMEAIGQGKPSMQPQMGAMQGMSVADIAGVGGRGQSNGPVNMNNWMRNPDLARGIIEAAAELQMDPADLATIISYETAGTFDPAKRGPTTQWGQHKGLIQFGQPQARQHGVDWNDPIATQLGRDGAIVRYYRDRGWKPGMSFEDAYSIVNAGAPGRYNASDANNGGAPGTVRDKVRNQMDGHRAKAQALLEAYSSAAPSPPPTNNTAAPAKWSWAANMIAGGAGR